ncbi:hypothetical protein SDC9_198533 [bioreactor metagenome]|uniref:Uncharacterized protein n=1 Tax=bioreactor metagenome TaxID=1076179 RepID=A0A645IUQ8_9ZZZZ
MFLPVTLLCWLAHMYNLQRLRLKLTLSGIHWTILLPMRRKTPARSQSATPEQAPLGMYLQYILDRRQVVNLHMCPLTAARRQLPRLWAET